MTIPDIHSLWRDLHAALIQTLATSQFAQGGMLIASLSALAVFARTLPGTVWHTLVSRHTLTLDVQGDDAAFPWLAAQPVGRRLQHLGVVTRDNEQMGGQNLTLATDQDGDDVNVRLVPLSDQVLLRFRGHWLLARPLRTQRQGQGGHALGGFDHSLTIQMLAASRGVIPELLRVAYECTAGKAEGRVEIHVPTYDSWTLAERRVARPLDTLIDDGDLLSGLRSDLDAFFADREWCAGMGIPYRRGYLLHGPPGNGNISLVEALAGAVGLNVCVPNLATPDLSDDRLTSLLSNLPRRALLLLEDIDAVFLGREPRTPSVKLSFNGLLNALDGVAAGEGRLTFMTTNDLNGLGRRADPPRSRRPPRADRQCHPRTGSWDAAPLLAHVDGR